MPKLDGTGPEENGSSGRKLGNCGKATESEKLQKLGKGMGKKRHSGGGVGRGKRLKSDEK
jgi:hypothetical protein